MPKPTQQPDSKQRQGLIISYFGSSVAVEADDGQVIPCQLHRNQALPVVGDRVEWQLTAEHQGTVTRILPRRSELMRGDAHQHMQILAANVDCLVIVMAPPPVFSEYLLDRYLLAAELLQITPLIVLNKIDLLDADARATVLAQLQPYAHIPYPILLTSVVSHEGLAQLSAALQHKTAVLVGPSGVGKSSIIATYNKDVVIRTADVSAKGAGKHTTTATRLYHLPGNIHLIDSPGVREFSLWSVSKEAVLQGFKEFAPFLTGCKFRNCQHLVEPGCAVRVAVTAGHISASRYANYQTLVKEMTQKPSY